MHPSVNADDYSLQNSKTVQFSAKDLANILALEAYSLQDLTLRIAWYQMLSKPPTYNDPSAELLMLSAFADRLRNVPVVRIESAVEEAETSRLVAKMQGNEPRDALLVKWNTWIHYWRELWVPWEDLPERTEEDLRVMSDFWSWWGRMAELGKTD